MRRIWRWQNFAIQKILQQYICQSYRPSLNLRVRPLWKNFQCRNRRREWKRNKIEISKRENLRRKANFIFLRSSKATEAMKDALSHLNDDNYVVQDACVACGVQSRVITVFEKNVQMSHLAAL